MTTVTVTAIAVADGYARGTATVMVEVVDTLRIETNSDMLSLEEGDSAQISVSVSRIEGSEVTINLEAPPGLSVSASELTFSRSSPDPKVITVTAVEDDRYTGDRSSTLTLTADGYTMATVTVDITEEEPPPVGLVVSPSPLGVVIGMSETFTVAVEEGVRTVIWMRSGNSEIASLPFEGYWGPDGFVGRSLEFTGGRYSGSQQSNPRFEVHGVNIGMTTVTVTAVADGYAAGTATVMVEVLDILRIGTDSDRLSLEEGDNTQVSVSVNRIAASEVTINIEAPEGLSVSPSELTFSRSSPDPKVITVTAVEDDRYTGDRSETLILTADGYTTATATVTVDITEDDLPPLEVAISPSPLGIVIGMSETFTVAVEEGVRTVIWMRSGNSEIASLPFEGYWGPDGFVGRSLEFTGGRYSQQSNPRFEVHGVNIGMTTVTVTAVADGYAAGTATVMVEVVDTLRIETDSDMLSLEEGDNTQVSVSVNRIAASEVTINVEAPEGLSVSPSELTFSRSSPDPKVITVTAVEDDRYTGDRSSTLTLTADGYTMATVTVDITEDDQPSLGLVVSPSPLGVVIGMSETFTVAVEEGVRAVIWMRSGNSEIASLPFEGYWGPDGFVGRSLEFTGGRYSGSQQSNPRFEVHGVNIGMTTVTVTAVADGYAAGTATVMVEVVDPLRITVNVALTLPTIANKTYPPGSLISETLPLVIEGTGTNPITYTLSPVLLNGLTFDAGERTIVGTAPATEQRRQYTYTAEDANGALAAQTFTIIIESPIIKVEPARLSLVEGGDSTQISVSVNRIAVSEVTINVEAPEGLSVSPSELTFSRSSPDPKVITVTAVEDVRYAGGSSATLTLTADGYTSATVTVDIAEDDSRPVVVDENYAGDRSSTLTLTADGYTTETVTVEIPEDDPQSAGLDPQLAGLNPQSTELRVEPPVLNLVSFESTKVEVRVASATLNVDSSTKPAVARATASTPDISDYCEHGIKYSSSSDNGRINGNCTCG